MENINKKKNISTQFSVAGSIIQNFDTKITAIVPITGQSPWLLMIKFLNCINAV